MRTAAILLALLFPWVLVASAHAQSKKLDPDVATLVRGNGEFAADLYQRLAAKDGNLFFSPYSISNALAMTYAGAKGNTAREMKTTLRFPLDDAGLHSGFGKLILQLHGEAKKRPFQLTVANRLWGQKNYGFLPDFTKTGQDHYHAGLEEVDFINATEEARKVINQWVEKQTNDKIKNLIPMGVLSADSRLVLTNAIYFKAAWMSPFRSESTKLAPFHLANGKTIQTPMMSANQTMRFADHGSFSVLEIPYVGFEQAMIVLLPKKKDGLGELEKNVTAENLNKWTAKFGTHSVDLKLPKFKITAEVALKDILQEMGMKDAFMPGKADFSGMATGEKLFISAVLHKAFVDVNEAGTEAAASTAVVVGTTSLPPPATFHADHPFVFLIRDNRTGSVLFMGRVANPG
jgi:serpin B